MTVNNDKPFKDDFERKFACHERRHMTASEYKTYDAMRAMAASGETDAQKLAWKKKHMPENVGVLVCIASEHTIANAAEQSKTVVSDNIASLREKGWLVFINRRQDGRTKILGTNVDRVRSHDALLSIEKARQNTAHPDFCPAMRYDPVTGKKNVKGKKPIGMLLAKNWKRIHENDPKAEPLDVPIIGATCPKCGGSHHRNFD